MATSVRSEAPATATPESRTAALRWRAAEASVALVATIAIATTGPVRLYARVVLAGLSAIGAAIALAKVDGTAVVQCVEGLVRATAIVAPTVVAFHRAERFRLVWAPITLPALVIAVASAPHGWGGALGTITLVVVAALAIYAQRWPRARAVAALPILLAIHPTMTVHQGYYTDSPGIHTLVADRCREHDGERPHGFDASAVTARYYAVTPVGDDRYLLTGEARTSRWLERTASGRFVLRERSRARGNYWAGTTGGGLTWLAHRDEVIAVRWTERGEQVRSISLLGLRADWETDVLDAVYDESTDSVFAGELAAGGLLRVPVDGSPGTRYPLDLFYLQIVPGSEGELLGVSSTDLVVIRARDGAIRDRTTAALCTGGIDACALDHAVAVTDYAGRVRLFERDRSGRYALTDATSAPAPRRIAFSPDCSLLAVTSADDETVLVLRRDGLAVLEEHTLGPGLRDVAWTPDGDLLVVDACTVTQLDAP